MGYQIKITGLNNLNNLFSIYKDITIPISGSGSKYTYVLVPKITDVKYRVVKYEDGRNINFYQSYDIANDWVPVTFEEFEELTFEFDTEEEALYFQIKFCS